MGGGKLTISTSLKLKTMSELSNYLNNLKPVKNQEQVNKVYQQGLYQKRDEIKAQLDGTKN